MEQNKYAKALRLYQQVLQHVIKKFGLEHLDVAKSKVNVGLVYAAMSEFEKALRMYNKALPVLETTLGPDHLDVANAKASITSIVSAFDQDHKRDRKGLEKQIQLQND